MDQNAYLLIEDIQKNAQLYKKIWCIKTHEWNLQKKSQYFSKFKILQLILSFIDKMMKVKKK